MSCLKIIRGWAPPKNALLEAEKARQNIEYLMGGGQVPDPDLQQAQRRSARTRDLNELAHGRGSQG